ncbi:AmmeMemoRadiSam system protein B [Candidatus Marinamargulisbacteria bacterium SCGC AAA071-K20]|nr:AmmeMemoRadiSam system protein B [Candidatus Marinamargulisbacteria bacterium SCGC AAA071-K20]
MPRIRKPVFAGTFYPQEPDQLESLLTSLFQSLSKQEPLPSTKGLISPHAGYVFSGKTAAYSFDSVKGLRPQTIIIIGPSHRVPFRGISVFEGDYYETPLGKVAINTDLVKKLHANNPLICFLDQAHSQEHSIEVEIPFLQHIYSHPFKVVGVVMGNQDQESVDILTRALLSECDKEKSLIIASSDLSHFYKAETAEQMDRKALDLIHTGEMDQFYKDNTTGAIQCCGYGPIMVTNNVVKDWGANKCIERHYCHSGGVSGDFSSVVGYGSVVYY